QRAADLHLASARPHETAGDLDERRLPGPVRTEQPDELPLLDVEIDRAQRHDPSVSLAQAADGERGGHPKDSTGAAFRPVPGTSSLSPQREARQGARVVPDGAYSSRELTRREADDQHEPGPG